MKLAGVKPSAENVATEAWSLDLSRWDKTMRAKTAANRDLPPRMIRRVRALKGGKEWVGYYYHGRNEDGKRMEIQLGGDLDIAKAEWAKLDCKPVPKKNALLAQVFDRY